MPNLTLREEIYKTTNLKLYFFGSFIPWGKNLRNLKKQNFTEDSFWTFKSSEYSEIVLEIQTK